MKLYTNFSEEAKQIAILWQQVIVEGKKLDEDETGVVRMVLKALNRGEIRVAAKTEDGKWQVVPWIKQAILLAFRLLPAQSDNAGPNYYYDKLPLKFNNYDDEDFAKLSVRVVSGAVVRYGAFLEKNVVIMPSFVNVGAYIGENTMIDTWSTVGSCAQIGKNCHIAGGAGIGGVLEPLQANPVIIEDDCFIGARSEIAEGVIVEQGAVISMGVFIGASTKIIDRETGEIFQGRVPAYSVVVSGSLPGKTSKDPNLYCGVIVKKVDAQTRAKTGINELLRI